MNLGFVAVAPRSLIKDGSKIITRRQMATSRLLAPLHPPHKYFPGVNRHSKQLLGDKLTTFGVHVDQMNEKANGDLEAKRTIVNGKPIMAKPNK